MSDQTAESQEHGVAWAADLLAVLLLTVVTAVVLALEATPSAARWLLGAPFLLLYPGYAAVAALFPEKGPRSSATDIRPSEAPTFTARIGLALVVSPVLLGVVGTVLSTQSAIRLGPSVAGVTLLTLAGLGIAALRRRRLARSLRAGLPANGQSVLGALGSNGQRLFLLVGVIAFATVTVAAVAVPPDGEAYTEAYLLGEDGDTASDLPTDLTTNETQTLSIGLENHENEEMSYEVVTVLQATDANGTVTAQQQLDEFALTLADEEQTIEQRPLEPTLTGEELRLQVLIYEGEASATPTAVDADQSLQVAVSVDNGS